MTDYFFSKLISSINYCQKIIIKFFVHFFLIVCVNFIFVQSANAATTHHAPSNHTKSIAHHKKLQKNNKSTIYKKKKRLAKKVRLMIPNRQPANSEALQQSRTSQIPNLTTTKTGFVASIEERLINFVHKTVGSLRYSIYKLGGSHFDTSRGVYIVDCSSYVDNILKNIYPKAYSSLVNWSGSDKPTTHDYYDFFSELNSNNNKHYWNKIDDVETLRPGDVLVFRYTNSRGNETGGHMMIVMDKPIEEDNNAYLVRVADSAATGHSEDTRKLKTSGIGIGTIVLKVDSETYQPTAFAWRVGSKLNKNVNVAMARPVDIGQSTEINQTPNSLPNYLRSLFKA